ncbi:hypothetical protein I315_04386 [Cryptococcus gattii Ru294]|nr:hypothetical protein I315_04386 [Cryptococcus gattii Ru294]
MSADYSMYSRPPPPPVHGHEPTRMYAIPPPQYQDYYRDYYQPPPQRFQHEHEYTLGHSQLPPPHPHPSYSHPYSHPAAPQPHMISYPPPPSWRPEPSSPFHHQSALPPTAHHSSVNEQSTSHADEKLKAESSTAAVTENANLLPRKRGRPRKHPLPAIPPDTGKDERASAAKQRDKKRSRGSEEHMNAGQMGQEAGSDELEAGLALAGLKRRESAPAPIPDGTPESVKRVKRENDDEKDEKKEKESQVKKRGEGLKKSCAECRRLKAKCDRVFPCSNCKRRGCALVCPDGDLSCMNGKRLVLASTKQLHERIQQLEAALLQAHRSTSSSTHPLLAPEYLDGGFASLPNENTDGKGEETKSPRPPLPEGSPIHAMSSPSFTVATPISSAPANLPPSRRIAVQSLLTEASSAPEGKREDEWAGENAAPAMIIGTGHAHSQPPSSPEDLNQRHLVFERLKRIIKVLPSSEVTAQKAERFWETSQWYQTILCREEFESVYFPAVYSPTPANPLSPHKLAVVLMVLTLEAYLDLEQDEDSPLVATYWDAVQACFDTRFGWAASIAGTQALALCTLFVGFGWRGTKASNFYWLRQMTSSALQLGLHRDAHPSFPAEEREFRRRVWHEVYVLDCLICLNHGQRASIPVEYIETAYPKGVSLLAYKKYDFIRMVKSRVIEIGSLPDNAPAGWDRVQDVKRLLMQFE